MAKKIVATNYISLDGVIEDPVGMENSGLGNWTGPFSRGPKGDRFKHDELFAAGALIFGRTTYEAFAAAWPHIKDEAGYADRINKLPKFSVAQVSPHRSRTISRCHAAAIAPGSIAGSGSSNGIEGGMSTGTRFLPATQASMMSDHSCIMWRRCTSYSALL